MLTNTPSEVTPPSGQRVTLVLTLWPERSTSLPPIWRGALETADGQRHYFRDEASLISLLSQLSGWPAASDSLPREENHD
ncbi:MAG: hypothetical protein KDE59_11035 [Anaerolineales bacterium]|nr:hypothetical protein [Anaerolineales bacterium]MCB0007356.1 hypothetical protein [Anaerolineales bacterium]MCB8960667.1 hypothetical protein [Ardenticatenales bacterium]